MSKINGIPPVPRIPEINAEAIWNDIKQEQNITKYFPEIYVTSVRVPDRTYLFTVLLSDFRSTFATNLSKDA